MDVGLRKAPDSPDEASPDCIDDQTLSAASGGYWTVSMHKLILVQVSWIYVSELSRPMLLLSTFHVSSINYYVLYCL